MIPFSPPRIDDKIINEVNDTLRSGWITTGRKTKLLEKKIAGYCRIPDVICLSSATAGLELALRWFGVSKGDEVILPAYTYCSTANVIIHCGATPVFVDIQKDDFNICTKEIRKHITGRTKVIIPVDIGGWTCDYSEINGIVEEEHIKRQFQPDNEVQQQLGRVLVLSDAAHSFGAEYLGKKTGALTDITVFSFHAVKNLTTAEGGAIVFNLPAPFDNRALYDFFNTLSLHGQNKDAFAKLHGNAWQYDVVMAGYKANMTDIHASIGLVEIERYENDTLKRRREIVESYNQGLGRYNWANLPVFQNDAKKSSCHLYLLRIDGINEEQRNNIIQEIYKQGVSVNVHFQPLPMLSFYRNKGYSIEDYPVSFDNYQREISLPVYYNLTNSQTEKVISAVSTSVEKHIKS